MAKRGRNLEKLDIIVQLLFIRKSLPLRYRDHPLKGNYKGYRDCHIEPDWLLIYRYTETELQLTRTGTHSDIFNN